MYPSLKAGNGTGRVDETLTMRHDAARRKRRAARATTLCTLGALSVILGVVLALGAASPLPSLASPTPAAASAHHDVPDRDAWYLVLVNDDHPIERCRPELTQLRNGQAVDARCYPDLQRMFDAARAEGLWPRINSSYRSREEQQAILDETIACGMRSGLSEDEARRQALRTVAEPGTSEHETGLAIDVSSDQQTSATDGAVHEWMAAHGWEYGWVLRYPAGKEDLTGIDNEPWHFRYVGADAARALHEGGLCLEEYLG